ncbi:response regulator transcription factor [Bacteroides sp.]
MKNTINSQIQSKTSLQEVLIRECVNVVGAVAQATNLTMYVIDLQEKEFLYVAENPHFRCGRSTDEIKVLGYSFFDYHVHPDDLKMFKEMHNTGINLLHCLSMDERKSCTIHYDFNLCNMNRKKVLINHKLTPLLHDREGNMRLMLCIVSVSPNIATGNMMITKGNSTQYYLYNHPKKKWSIKDAVNLSGRQKDILHMFAQGYTTKEISEKLEIAVSTVDKHKKHLYERLGIHDRASAIAVASYLGYFPVIK